MKVRFVSLVLLFCGLWFASCQLGSSDKIIYVNTAFKDSATAPSQKYIQIKTDLHGKWTSLPGEIEGFDYQQGHFYKLKVSENPAVEGIVPSYALVELLEKSETPLTLDNGYWIVVSMLDGTKFPRTPVFSISENNIEGNTSCNKFSGILDISAETFKTSIVKSTDMGCNTLPVEKLFLETLQRVERYHIKGDSLLLRDGHNKKIMTCVYYNE